MEFIHPMKKSKYYPISDNNSKILILGSFPSEKWDDGGFYYGSSRNRFWHLIVGIFEERFSDTNSFSYKQIKAGSKIDNYVKNMECDDKEKLLLKNNIALWDIVDECNSETGKWPSSDDNIEKGFTQNDIFEILEANKKINKVIFTGSSKLKQYIANKIKSEFGEKIEIECLPSPTAWVISRYDNVKRWQNLLKG